jgi:hypothetical protein
MGATFLELTNNLLRRINEVEIDASSFSTVRGIQSVAKDCILDSIRGINQQRWQWPFHALQYTQTLAIATNEYSWPADFKSVDWESFQIKKDDAIGQGNNKHLEPLNRADWYTYYRDRDNDNNPNGLSIPDFVFRGHGPGFGVTPVPEKAYTLQYRYYYNPAILSAATDATTIPDEYTNVIIWGALYHMNLFRENPEGAGMAKSAYNQGIDDMYNILIENVAETLVDTRVNFGGSPFFNFTGGYHT